MVDKPILADCLCCGKKTPHGIPYTVCNDCRKIIDKFLKTRENYENSLMSMRGVEKMPDFDSGMDDVDFYLETIRDMVFTIEKQLEWIKNNLINIQTEVRCRLKEKENKDVD